MISTTETKMAVDKGFAEAREFEGLEYIRFRSSYKKIERGSVITKNGFFPGFPHIKRIFTLKKGLERNITSEYVFAEEKIDGYNVRAIESDGKIYALTRGGIVDAFSTEKLREIIPTMTLKNKGNAMMLCGEMIGNTPYTRPAKDFDVKYFVFDVYDLGRGEYVQPEKKYAFLKKNRLKSVPSFGKFHLKKDFKKLYQLVLNVNKAKKEGIVFKSEDRKNVVKYVNPNADIEDIGNVMKQIFDMPIGHINQRILRSGIFVKEYGLDIEKYGKTLGTNIYKKFSETLKMLEKKGVVYDEFEISVRDPAVWDELKSHMGKEVRLEKLYERWENGKTRIRFRKIYIRTTRKLREFLNGKGIMD